VARRAFFLDVPLGRRFCLLTRPERTARGSILYVHPFAEEMNRSRRMAALAAAAFARRGWSVLQIDLHGCGDSYGDFGDATWQSWLDDVHAAWEWLRGHDAAPAVAWGMRAGALLVTDWIAANSLQPAVLLWQPVLSGRQHLTQFLRLKATGGMLEDTQAGNTLEQLRADLAAGRPIEVAGYAVRAQLARALECSTLALPARYGSPAGIVEARPDEGEELSPALGGLVARWRGQGARVDAQRVAGPSFWQTIEIETVPSMIAWSAQWLETVPTP
jgi:exosortase A-associated hydrolase 2